MDLACERVDVDVLGAVHLSRSEQVGRLPREQKNVRLASEPAFDVERPLSEDERHPLSGSVFFQVGHIERAAIEQRQSAVAVARVVCAGGDELVEVLEARAITGVHDCVACGRQCRRCRFVLETVDHRPLPRTSG